jgi:WbqC-like protein family
MADRVVACHQPNFLPWLGFFAKIARSDVFFLLDDVQFTQGANRHNWTSRVRIGAANGPMWLSLPVRRSGEGRQLILDLKTDDQSRWLPKMLKTLEESYRKAPHSAECLPLIVEILLRHQGSVCETNIELIHAICEMLGLSTTVIRSSQQPVEGTATERLVNLTRSANGTTYLSGDGADDYQLIDEFGSAGMQLRKLGFVVEPYPQRRGADFVPGLSIVDALCNVGMERTKKMLRG